MTDRIKLALLIVAASAHLSLCGHLAMLAMGVK